MKCCPGCFPIYSAFLTFALCIHRIPPLYSKLCYHHLYLVPLNVAMTLLRTCCAPLLMLPCCRREWGTKWGGPLLQVAEQVVLLRSWLNSRVFREARAAWPCNSTWLDSDYISNNIKGFTVWASSGCLLLHFTRRSPYCSHPVLVSLADAYCCCLLLVFWLN